MTTKSKAISSENIVHRAPLMIGLMFCCLSALPTGAIADDKFEVFWQEQQGKAMAVALGNDGSLWKLGPNRHDPTNPNYSVNKWDGSGWQNLSGWGVRMTVDGEGNAWIINSVNDLRRYIDLKSTTPVQGAEALDVEADNIGKIWIVGTDNKIRSFDAEAKKFNSFKKPFPGKATAVATVKVGDDAFPFVIDDKGNSHRFTGVDWQNTQLPLVDMTVGADGVVWGTDKGDRIWRCEVTVSQRPGQSKMASGNWEQVNGIGRRVSAGMDGGVLHVNPEGEIYRGENEFNPDGILGKFTQLNMENRAFYGVTFEVTFTLLDDTVETWYTSLGAGKAPPKRGSWAQEILSIQKPNTPYSVKAKTWAGIDAGGARDDLLGNFTVAAIGSIRNPQLSFTPDTRGPTPPNKKEVAITFKNKAGFRPIFKVASSSTGEVLDNVGLGPAPGKTVKKYFLNPNDVVIVTATQRTGRGSVKGTVTVRGASATIVAKGAIRRGEISSE